MLLDESYHNGLSHAASYNEFIYNYNFFFQASWELYLQIFWGDFQRSFSLNYFWEAKDLKKKCGLYFSIGMGLIFFFFCVAIESATIQTVQWLLLIIYGPKIYRAAPAENIAEHFPAQQN